jgi:hypothetical protein
MKRRWLGADFIFTFEALCADDRDQYKSRNRQDRTYGRNVMIGHALSIQGLGEEPFGGEKNSA